MDRAHHSFHISKQAFETFDSLPQESLTGWTKQKLLEASSKWWSHSGRSPGLQSSSSP